MWDKKMFAKLLIIFIISELTAGAYPATSSKHETIYIGDRIMSANENIKKLESSRYNFNLTETEKAYIAGIVDGEGSIYIRCQESERQWKKRWSVFYHLRLVVGNTNKMLIDYLESKLGGYVQKRGPDKRPNCQPMYNWMVHCKKAYEVLEAIAPYLIVKRAHFQIAQKFQQTIGEPHGARNRLTKEVLEYRHKLMNELRAINKHKGRRVRIVNYG